MIEVDVFWSFAFGASFAACSAATLKGAPFWVNPIIVQILLFLALIFVPSGVYLLWAFPHWESMFLLGQKETIHAILPTVFTFTNTLLGLIGYAVTYRAIQRQPVTSLSIHKYWIDAYTIFAAILGMGYRRFTYTGSYDDWRAGKPLPMLNFFNPFKSAVFVTLLAMSLFVLPPVYYVMFNGAREIAAAQQQENGEAHYKLKLVRYVLARALSGFFIVCVGWIAGMYTLFSAEDLDYFSDGPLLRHFAPLVGFAVAQMVVFLLLLVPFLAIDSPRKEVPKAKFN